MLRQRKSILRLVVFYISVISLLAVIVLSCNQSKPSDTYYGEVARVISGKVEEYTAGKAQLEAKLLFSDFDSGTGQIETNGTFTLSYKKLEDILGRSELAPITYLACEAIIADDQESARYMSPITIDVLRQGEKIGEMISYSREASASYLPKVNDYVVIRMVVDKDVSIKGSCEGDEQNRDFNLELKKGWNIVVVTITAVDAQGNVTAARMETKPVPPGARWWFIKAE